MFKYTSIVFKNTLMQRLTLVDHRIQSSAIAKFESFMKSMRNQHPSQKQRPKFLPNKYILILRMSTTLTSGSHNGFGSFTNKTSSWELYLQQLQVIYPSLSSPSPHSVSAAPERVGSACRQAGLPAQPLPILSHIFPAHLV